MMTSVLDKLNERGTNVDLKPKKGRLTPFTIALIYTFFGGLWIFFSNTILGMFLNDPALINKLDLLNRWVFMVVSAQILYLLIVRHEKAMDRSHDSLRRVVRSLMVFRSCSKVITRDTEERKLLMEICRNLVEIGGYRMAWVGFAQHDEEQNVKPIAHWGYADSYLDTLRVTWADNERGQGPAGKTIRTGQTMVVQHILTNPQFKPWREEALKHGYKSVLSLPLQADKAIFGALVIMAGESDAFNAEEVDLLEELAEDLSYGIQNIRERSERERVEEKNKVLAAVIEQASDGVLTFDAVGTVKYANPAIEKICEISAKNMIGKTISNLECYQRNKGFFRAVLQTIETGRVCTGTYTNHKNDGNAYEIEAKISPVWGQTPTTANFVASIQDITRELQLEAQLRIAQKMEAIATLSGGIAHDFNNILAAILINTEMALEDVAGQNELREYLETVLKAAIRGKSLIKQIKNLSHQADQQRQPVHVEKIIHECLNLLRASLPATIEMRNQIAPDLGVISADPTQIHQVILNLCTNAADAMQERGGLLEVRLEAADVVGGSELSYPGLHPGHYLKLTVTDTGHGMDRQIMKRIFDPFFTTKGPGKGTGLGLSVALGIIKSHDGMITVDSELGKGSTFKVFLPCISRIEVFPKDEDVLPIPGGSERILFVDDEEDLVSAGAKMLKRLGYDVMARTDCREALELFTAEPNRFDLLITDQVMPHMTGEMLAAEILRIRPDLPIILCSGLSSSAHTAITMERIKSIGIKAFLPKPFQKTEIACLIRRLLD